MKSSRIFGALIILVQFGSAVALVLGMYSMLGVFATALPQGGGSEMEIGLTDPVVFPIMLTPTNPGYLDTTMEVRVAIVVDGVEIASDETKVTIASGATVPIELELSVPLSEAQEYLAEATEMSWETDIKVTSMFDLISFSNKMTIVGGVGQ